MSMLSSQIDELRQMADGGATYRDARVVMLQAADTIWELRDDLQRANAENAKLRELVNDLYFDLLGEMPESMLEDRRLQMRELGIEVD